MKNKIITSAFVLSAVVALSSCLQEQALEIQKPYTYDEQYFKNIREYKQTKHSVSYAFYAAWAPVEGVAGYKDPASWGERIIGLPDSLDICNLWMGIPSNDPTEDNYAPVAYADMKYSQEKLGTRFVSHTDASNTRTTMLDGVEVTFDDLSADSLYLALDAYAKKMVDDVLKYGLDGVDIDYEPQTATWLNAENLTYLVQQIHKVFGPEGEHPEKLIIVDYFSHQPSETVEPYIDYLVKQQYSHQLGTSLAAVNSNYARVEWCPLEKYIICETFGTADFHLNGGSPCRDENNQYYLYTTDGSVMYTIEAYARWAKERNAGFGAFYIDRNYYSKSGVPYREFRRAIQIANPSIH